jgi:hypothetical protein
MSGATRSSPPAGALVPTPNDKGVVEHGSDPTVARPVGYQSIEWIGTVAPDNAIGDDTWVNPDDTLAGPVAAHNALTAGIHGISDTTKLKAIVNHGATASVPRPSGFTSVEWIGTVAPLNALSADTWVNPNDGTGGGRLLEGVKSAMTDALAVALGVGAFYLASDENGGTLYYGNGATWIQAGSARLRPPTWLPPKVISPFPLTQGWGSAALGVANRVYMNRIPEPVSGTLDKLALAIGSTVGGNLLAGIYRIATDGSRELLWKMPAALNTTGLASGWKEVATGIGLALDDTHTYAFAVVCNDATTQMFRVNQSTTGMAALPTGWWSVNGSSSSWVASYTHSSFDLPATIADGSLNASATAFGMAGRML